MRVKGYWVYTHTTPTGLVYVGMSRRVKTCLRWGASCYSHCSLEPYIEEFGWDSIRHEVIRDGMTKEEAYQLEDELIRKYKAEGICINERCSGGLGCDGKFRDYQRQYEREHREEIMAYQRQYYQAHREEIKVRDRAWRAAHREEYNAKKRAYRAANREEINAKERARDRAWRAAHREEYNAKQRAYNEANRDKVNAKARAYYGANKDEINAKRRARYNAKKQQKSPKLITPVTNPNTQPSDYQCGQPLF